MMIFFLYNENRYIYNIYFFVKYVNLNVNENEEKQIFKNYL